jgi:Ig-like domain-containing protein
MTRKIKVVSVFFTLLLLTLLGPAGDSGVTEVSAGGYCDWVQYVADVTIPDGLPVDPGFTFRKTWRLKNIGTCTWTRSYKMVFVGGTQMGGVAAMNLPRDVAPGQTIDLSIGLTAPLVAGPYTGYWELQNPAGGLFGFGPGANRPFFVEIEVRGAPNVAYDFVANAAAANWRTEAPGKIIFPGVYGDFLGFVIPINRPILENGIPSPGAGLLMAPPLEYNEHIYGIFPPYEVKRGDRFQAFVGCEYGARECEVTFVLQYQRDGEPSSTRSFWGGWKSYKNTFSRVNLNLSPLAGQRLRFILLIRPNGPTIGDYAVWANPVIVSTSAPGPAVPTVTPLPVTAVPTVSTVPPTTGCDRAHFVSDVTVPDGTVFAPGQTFTKTWKLKNTGRCTWTTDYSLVFSTGDQMGGPSSISLPSVVAPNQTIDLSVNLTAPTSSGNYRGYWLLKNPSGGVFGIGVLGNRPFWLAINVAGSPPPSSANGYDFAAHFCDAQWSSSAGALPCPSTSALDGQVTGIDNPRLENNTVYQGRALLTIPQNIYNGYIQGVFPPFTVQSGDRFKSIVNCEYQQRSCYVVYRLDYQIDNGPVQNLWAFGERHEGLFYQADVDLSSLAGQNVKFILRTNANGSPTGDRALWVAPAIVRSGAAFPVVPTATVTLTPSATTVPGAIITDTPMPAPATATVTPMPTLTATVAPPVNPGQLTYTNQRYGFQFTYPGNGVMTSSQDNFAHLNLPFTAGTNLVEKYLEVTIFENVSTCSSPLTNGLPPGSFESQTITGMNGIQFIKQSAQEGALGNVYDWVAYSTTKGTACISMNFVLHSTNAANNPVPPPAYNKELESAVFLNIISAFQLTAP